MCRATGSDVAGHSSPFAPVSLENVLHHSRRCGRSANPEAEPKSLLKFEYLAGSSQCWGGYAGWSVLKIGRVRVVCSDLAFNFILVPGLLLLLLLLHHHQLLATTCLYNTNSTRVVSPHFSTLGAVPVVDKQPTVEHRVRLDTYLVGAGRSIYIRRPLSCRGSLVCFEIVNLLRGPTAVLDVD
jgi:hypothetical protein